MAKASTTHVIEIETGIGEPAFIPLTMGQELQPISVGKKGMWRIESARVLDVHAFVYFDGTSLFLQSADEAASASVDGYKVGKAWTELHAPCKIEIGAARLRFRSLLAGADVEQPDPATFPKGDRPFKPGEFAHQPAPGEDTRVKPLNQTGGRPAVDQQQPPPQPTAPRPAAGRPITGDIDNATRAEGSGNLHRTAGMMIPQQQDSTMGMPPQQGMHGGGMPMQGGGMPMQGMPMQGGGPMQGMPMGMPPGQTGPPGMPMMGGGGGHGMGNSLGTGPFYPQGSGPYNAMGPGMGGYGSMTGGQMGPPPPEGSLPYYLAKYKELSPPKRILVVLAPFCLLAAGYLLLFDDQQEVPHNATTVDAGVDTGLAAVQPPPPPPIVTPPPPPPPPIVSTALAQPSCPPGFVPYTIPINGQIPCVPAGTPMPAKDAAALQPPPPPPPPPPPGPNPNPPPPVAANTKTLERQAVDYVAVNDYAHAAAVYEELQRQNPQNRVYAEAARILRQKADAGAP